VAVGFTGLWAAIQAKEADPSLDVVLVEAGKVAMAHRAVRAESFPLGDAWFAECDAGLSAGPRRAGKAGQENLDGFKDR
jgi:hypothetical protein